MKSDGTDNGHLGPSDRDEYTFCHNDVSQQNIVVDPNTLKFNAFID
jgi:thiamine kinase-like enzyme